METLVKTFGMTKVLRTTEREALQILQRIEAIPGNENGEKGVTAISWRYSGPLVSAVAVECGDTFIVDIVNKKLEDRNFENIF